MLSLDIDGERVERCYTISSPPTRPARVAITVKRQLGGIASNWLHDQLMPGASVLARGPYGAFSPSRHPAGRYLFLSGGSGATPMISALRTFFDLAEPVDVAYVHSARSPLDILFRHELEMLSTSISSRPTAAISHVCEEDAPDEVWRGPRGRVGSEVLAALVPDIASREIFACGPVPYLEAVRKIVAILGVPAENYHEESFVLAGSVDQASTTTPPGDAPTNTYTVEFARSRRSVECEPGSSLLAAAARAGVPVPSSCGQGMCGTCKATRLSGEVDMSHQGGIRPREIAAGKILLCCSVPTSNVVIDA